MILGIGTDIIETERIREMIAKWDTHFIEKVFTKTEIEYCKTKSNPVPHFAARFAAKEAFYKALPKNRNYPLSWQHIEVINKDGKPTIKFYSDREEHKHITIHLSLSHTEDSAVATVVIEHLSARG
jgi:holo-[acyl-carrier protein] synthase